MRSGPLRDRVTIKTVVRTADDYGGFSRSDTDLITIWADVKPISAKEAFYARQLRQETTHKIITRYRSDVKQGMTLVCEGVEYYVLAVTNPDRVKRIIEIQAREGGHL